MILSHIEEDYIDRINKIPEDSNQLEFTLRDYCIKLRHYLPPLLYCPEDPYIRLDIYSFLEMYRKALVNSDYAEREDMSKWAFDYEGFYLNVYYKINDKYSSDPYDCDVVDVTLDTNKKEIPNDLLSWLHEECKVLLSQYENYKYKLK